MFENALRNVRNAIWTAKFARAKLVMAGYTPTENDIAELEQAETALFERV